MRYGLSIPPFADAATVVELGRVAEDAGWDGVFLWDHVQWSPRADPQVHDPWVLLGAVAVQTHRVLLGTLVTPLSRRRPTTLAKQVLTLDQLSGGRAVLGVGLGEPVDRDFADLGEVSGARERAEVLDESLTVLDGLLRGDRVDHDGAHFKVHAQFRPGPTTRPRPPIWVAGVLPNRRPLERARRWDGVAPIGAGLTPDALQDYVGADLEAGWEVLAPADAEHRPEQWQAAGATWLIESARPDQEGWLAGLTERIQAGPLG